MNDSNMMFSRSKLDSIAADRMSKLAECGWNKQLLIAKPLNWFLALDRYLQKVERASNLNFPTFLFGGCISAKTFVNLNWSKFWVHCLYNQKSFSNYKINYFFFACRIIQMKIKISNYLDQIWLLSILVGLWK